MSTAENEELFRKIRRHAIVNLIMLSIIIVDSAVVRVIFLSFSYATIAASLAASMTFPIFMAANNVIITIIEEKSKEKNVIMLFVFGIATLAFAVVLLLDYALPGLLSIFNLFLSSYYAIITISRFALSIVIFVMCVLTIIASVKIISLHAPNLSRKDNKIPITTPVVSAPPTTPVQQLAPNMPTSEMNYCPQCGSQVKLGAKFCEKCGKNLTP
ncbi:MAG: hypothetical protein RBG13Loki_2329 [Promethearchaeota archaeon CR_4]|nr:MAG: hypothetical protein RBG13Loki_2329 [Candidatus Lokiarchaeota archaeon CR_4]